ncbi:MAG: FAD-dependent thymidylate synthase, partial [Nitrososphaera sp.]|nr:FAD-dependent thymidylate synthase [Nitrososphaera sp.]
NGFMSCRLWYAAKLLIYTKDTRLQAGMKRLVDASDAHIEAELSYIAKTIRSSWEFVDYTFQITDVTRAFTHQLVRTRTASYAQQSQRSVDMSRFKALIPDSVSQHEDKRVLNAWDTAMDGISEAYSFMRSNGIAEQDCRGVLPTNVLTNIIAKMNLRTLADLLGKRRSLRAQGEYTSVAREMERCVITVHPWVEMFINPERTRTPALDQILKDMLGAATPASKPLINNALKELDNLKGTWG